MHQRTAPTRSRVERAATILGATITLAVRTLEVVRTIRVTKTEVTIIGAATTEEIPIKEIIINLMIQVIDTNVTTIRGITKVVDTNNRTRTKEIGTITLKVTTIIGNKTNRMTIELSQI